MSFEHFPTAFRRDIQLAASILQSLGAKEIYVFGSLVEGSNPSGARDLDIAVLGLPPEQFFHAYGQLLMELDHAFDLVDLSNSAAFSRRLKESGRLERVA